MTSEVRIICGWKICFRFSAHSFDNSRMTRVVPFEIRHFSRVLVTVWHGGIQCSTNTHADLCRNQVTASCDCAIGASRVERCSFLLEPLLYLLYFYSSASVPLLWAHNTAAFWWMTGFITAFSPYSHVNPEKRKHTHMHTVKKHCFMHNASGSDPTLAPAVWWWLMGLTLSASWVLFFIFREIIGW